MRTLLLSLGLLFAGTSPLLAGEKAEPKPNTLTPKEIADGWILLFDGESIFGWEIPSGDVKYADGKLNFKKGIAVTTTSLGESEVSLEHRKTAETGALTIGGNDIDVSSGKWSRYTFRPSTSFAINGQGVSIRNVKAKPANLKSIFNGKDLTGWKEIPDHKSKFAVTDKGELSIKDGNGDLHSEGQYADFVLQVEVYCNTEKLPKGKHSNSGVFFRCQPGKFWSGYEAQIWNGYKDNDRTKADDYGTGGIYNRQPTRKVVSNDNEWFTMTVAAHGNHLACWVNGYQTADFTDTRPTKTTARDGNWTKKGPISLQGHDPTTDLLFRNIRIGELPKDAK